MGCAQAFAPLREGGAALWKERQWDCAFGTNGKGGGGSTAGGRCCMRPLGPSAKVLIVAGAESCLPRRPSAVLPPSRPLPFSFFHAWTSHSWPRHAPLGGGRSLAPSLILAFAHWIAEEEAVGKHGRSVSGGIGQIGVCFVGRCPCPSSVPIQKPSTPSREGPASSGPCPQGAPGTCQAHPSARPRRSAALPWRAPRSRFRATNAPGVRLSAATWTWPCCARPSQQASPDFRGCGFQPRRWM